MHSLIAAALKSEVEDYFKDEKVILTGVGKINAAYALTKALHTARPDFVFNLGTAGSPKHPHGSVVICDRFYQRDMDVSPLGFTVGVTPFSTVPAVLEYGCGVDGYQKSLCGTGDSFSVHVEKNNAHCDVLDMEAYALALVCKNENIPFVCIKYITDGGDSSKAADHWVKNLDTAPLALYKAYQDICAKMFQTAALRA